MSDPRDQRQSSSWQAVALVGVIALVVGGIGVSAVLRYDDSDDALKIWAGLSGLVGILIGAGATYFPASVVARQSESYADETRRRADRLEGMLEDSHREVAFWTRATSRLAIEASNKRWKELLKDIPELRSVRRT